MSSNIIYSNQANKILFRLYNSAEEETDNSNIDAHIEPENTSITILTSGMYAPQQLHIRIKNNYKSEATKSATDESEEPNQNLIDSNDIKPSLFAVDEDVLMKNIDDKLYLGTITNIKNGKYLVKFDDDTEKWSPANGLKKLNSSSSRSETEDHPLCVVCKQKSEADLVQVCNKCSRGYHRHCMMHETSNFSSPWCCNRCTAQYVIHISDSEDNEQEDSNSYLELPYNVNILRLVNLQFFFIFLYLSLPFKD